MSESDKNDFIKYENIRRSGKYNMVFDASKVSSIMGVSIDRYIWIVENYLKLKELYGSEVQ